MEINIKDREYAASNGVCTVDTAIITADGHCSYSDGKMLTAVNQYVANLVQKGYIILGVGYVDHTTAYVTYSWK